MNRLAHAGRTGLFAALLLAACTGPKGPKGDQGDTGPQGPQGPQGVAIGWGSSGNDVYTTLDGGVGIGTSTPQATLDVRGTLHVEEDLSLRPVGQCKGVTFDNPVGDLGDQIAPLLTKYRCINILLKASTNWTWNNPIALQQHQYLSLTGEGYTNGANTLTVNILMTQNRTRSVGGTDYREPGRVFVPDGASFSLNGVNLVESARDPRPLTPSCQAAALFNANGAYSIIDLSQIRIAATDDIVNFSDRAFVNVRFGWTFIDKNTGSPRDIVPVKSYSGWCFVGGFGFVHRSHTTLGTGVTWDPNVKISYSN